MDFFEWFKLFLDSFDILWILGKKIESEVDGVRCRVGSSGEETEKLGDELIFGVLLGVGGVGFVDHIIFLEDSKEIFFFELLIF